MIESARHGRADGLRCNICIIGGGAAGITLACELDGLNASVLLLEAGSGDKGKVSQDALRGSSEGVHPAPDHFRRLGFGGATSIWGGRCVPYDPIDFEKRDYVGGSGWPIDYKEVAQHYAKALNYCEAGVPDFRVSNALDEALPTFADLPFDSALDTDAIERYSLPSDFGKSHRRQLESSRNVTVLTHSHVVRLERDSADGRITAAVFAVSPGVFKTVHAEVFVVATGGIETARLLLASDTAGPGLGNSGDALGRHYMCHIENVIGVLRPGTARPKFDFETTRDGVYARRKIHFTPTAQRQHRLLNIAFRLHYPPIGNAAHGSPVLSSAYIAKRLLIPEYRRILLHGQGSEKHSSVLPHIGNIARDIPGLVRFSGDWVRRRVLARRKLPYVLVANRDGSYPLEFNAEQSPNPSSRITLGRERDAYGVPRVHIGWRLSPEDVESVCRSFRLLKKSLDLVRSCTLELDDSALEATVAASQPVGGHHIGTARIALDASRGVVDTNCAVFGSSNLYVAGAATFPTSSHANPTLTIVAMAIRLGAHLRRQRDALQVHIH